MAISHLQDLAVSASSSTTSLQSGAMGSALTNGSTVLVFVWLFSPGGSTTSSVTDTAGNTYARDQIVTNGTTVCEVWRAQNTHTTASNKITVNLAGSCFLTFCAAEFTGLLSVSPLDGAGSTNSGSGTNPTVTTGAFSTTNANDLLIGTYSTGGQTAVTGPAGFTNVGQEVTGGTFRDGSADYKVVSATQTNVNPSWSTTESASVTWAAIGLAYKASATTTYLLRSGDLNGLGGGPFGNVVA